ncbi:hypothetical protein [Streptomyces sp. NPDC001296]
MIMLLFAYGLVSRTLPGDPPGLAPAACAIAGVADALLLLVGLDGTSLDELVPAPYVPWAKKAMAHFTGQPAAPANGPHRATSPSGNTPAALPLTGPTVGPTMRCSACLSTRGSAASRCAYEKGGVRIEAAQPAEGPAQTSAES